MCVCPYADPTLFLLSIFYEIKSPILTLLTLHRVHVVTSHLFISYLFPIVIPLVLLVLATSIIYYLSIIYPLSSQLVATDRKFSEFCQKARQNPRCENLSLMEFMMEPVQVSLSLSLRFKSLFLYNGGVLCNVECCIRQLCPSSIIHYDSFNVT